MNRVIAVLMACLLVLLPSRPICAQTGGASSIGGLGSFGGGVAVAGTTWTVLHSASNVTCKAVGTGTGPFNNNCVLSISSTTAGKSALLLYAMFGIGGGATFTLNAPTGEAAATHCSNCKQAFDYGGGDFEIVDGYYILSETGGTTSITFSTTMGSTACGATDCGVDVAYIEVSKSSGSVSLDTSASNTNASCTACTGPTLTLTGSNDYCAAWAGMSQTNTAPSSPWTNPSIVETSNVEGTFVGALNQTSWPGISFPQSPAGGYSGAALCLK